MVKEKLIFKGVSEIIGTEDFGLLILTDEKEERQISIVCDKAMAVQIELRIKKIPIVNIMLPEVLCKLLKIHNVIDQELVIYDLLDGQYCTRLFDDETGTYVPVRASDAVLLSIVCKIPLYIDAGLMKRQSVVYSENSRGVSLPVNTISDKMLQTALDRAIYDENYELASYLRDEKRRRNKDSQINKLSNES